MLFLSLAEIALHLVNKCFKRKRVLRWISLKNAISLNFTYVFVRGKGTVINGRRIKNHFKIL